MNNNPKLYLFRGLPSSGKTTFANEICDLVFAADDYFYTADGEYNFNIDKLHQAHKTCLSNTIEALENGCPEIAVTNTFTTEKELKPYIEAGHKYGYKVTTVIVESRHDNKNGHNVPEETVDRMRDRFSIKL